MERVDVQLEPDHPIDFAGTVSSLLPRMIVVRAPKVHKSVADASVALKGH